MTVNSRRFWFTTFRCRTLLLGLLLFGAIPGHAQDVNSSRKPATNPPVANPPEQQMFLLDLLRYDARTDGPLMFAVPDLLHSTNLIVGPDIYQRFQTLYPAMTPAQMAEQMQGRVIHEGALTAIVPRNLVKINTNPGKANPFGTMSESDQLSLFQSLLTPEQWKLFGGPSGIGWDDLNEDQRSLFVGLIPSETLTVTTSKRDASSADSPLYRPEKTEQIPRESVRLRCVRRLNFRFLESKAGEEVTSCSSPANDYATIQRKFEGEDGIERIQDVYAITPPDEDRGTPKAFGVPLIRTETNSLKPGQMSLDAPALSVGIPLQQQTETVGALLQRIATATRIDLVADRRLAAQTAGFLLPPDGATVSASDLLKTICRSFGGTFRRLETSTGPLYLLTFDIEGVGTQLARLGLWGDEAYNTRQSAILKGTFAMAKADPLAAVGFAPDDPYTLSPEQVRALDTLYTTSEKAWEGMQVPVSALSPVLRKSFTKSAQSWQKDGHAVKTDRINLAVDLVYEYVLPDQRSFQTSFFNPLDLASFVGAAKRKAIPPGKRPGLPDPRPMPRTLTQRVAVVPLPANKTAAKQLFRLLRRKGFTETWLDTSLYAPDTPRQIAQMVETGKSAGMLVGVSVAWLQRLPEETVGVEDRNILGETGTAVGERLEKMFITANPTVPRAMFASYIRASSGWLVPDANIATTPLQKLARIPHLSSLCLTSTAAPGWSDKGEDNRMGNFMIGKMGYSLPTRIACVRSDGFDPVDVAEQPSSLSYSGDLNGIPQKEAIEWLAAFLSRTNQEQLQPLFSVLQSANKSLPLYLDDRINPFGVSRGNAFVRWETDRSIPPAVDATEEALEKCRSQSKNPLYSYQPDHAPSPQQNAIDFGVAATRAVKLWKGIVLDLHGYSMPECEKYLQALPDFPADAVPGKTR